MTKKRYLLLRIGLHIGTYLYNFQKIESEIIKIITLSK